MKKLLFLSAMVLAGITAFSQADKSKRPSPPAKATETTSGGVTITIDYSQPSLKGRKIGGEVAPYGQIWRTGANEPTTIEVNKAAKLEGKDMPAGKYSLWTVPGKDEWAIIINKKVPGWGTQYPEGEDLFRVNVKPVKTAQASERMTFTIAKNGKIALLWGDTEVPFHVK